MSISTDVEVQRIRQTLETISQEIKKICRVLLQMHNTMQHIISFPITEAYFFKIVLYGPDQNRLHNLQIENAMQKASRKLLQFLLALKKEQERLQSQLHAILLWANY